MNDELFIKSEEDTKRVVYLAKELLKNKNELRLNSSHHGAKNVSYAAKALENMGFATVSDIKTTTSVKENKRRIQFSVLVTKTKEFDKLYEESVQRKKEAQEKREQERSEVKK